MKTNALSLTFSLLWMGNLAGFGQGLLIGKLYDEATVLNLAKACQDATTFHTAKPPAFLQ